jgi:hypothetical protein
MNHDVYNIINKIKSRLYESTFYFFGNHFHNDDKTHDTPLFFFQKTRKI